MKFRFEGHEFTVYSFYSKIPHDPAEVFNYLPYQISSGLQKTSAEHWCSYVLYSLNKPNNDFELILLYLHQLAEYKKCFRVFHNEISDFIYNGFTPLQQNFKKFSLSKRFITTIIYNPVDPEEKLVRAKFYIDIKINDPHLQTLFALRFPNLKIVE